MKNTADGGRSTGGRKGPNLLRLSSLQANTNPGATTMTEALPPSTGTSSLKNLTSSTLHVRKNSSLVTPRSGQAMQATGLMTPRGQNRFGSFIRTSYLEENKKRKGFNFRLKFEDAEVEAIYMLESWKKNRKGYLVLLSVGVLGSVWDWTFHTGLTSRPWLNVLIGVLLIFAAIFQNDDPTVARTYARCTGYGWSFMHMLDCVSACGEGVTDMRSCERLRRLGDIPVSWLLAPLIVQLVLHFAPVSFDEVLVGRLAMIATALSLILSYSDSPEHLGIALSFASANLALMKQVHNLERQDRGYFLEAHLALKQLHSIPPKDESSEQEEATLVRNAMHLAFPENPFHDAATEARIERCRSELGVANQDNVISNGLVILSNAPVPRHAQFLASRLRGIKVARYKLHGDPVVVQSIPNLEVLETDEDLEEFIKVVNDASDLAEIPGLTKTVGFCLSPCTFVVEDVLLDPIVTLRDLALELGANELKLDWCFFKPLAACLSGTLAVMHRNGVLHRHVSSATILLTAKESCVLPPVSFHHAFPEARKKLYGVPGIWGVASEAKKSPHDYTASSEVWAFCVVAWEMLVGPFRFQVTPFAFPPTVPKNIVHLIIEGLSDDPDGRPTMDELYNAFNQTDPFRDSTVDSAEVFERVLQRLDGENRSVATMGGSSLDRFSVSSSPPSHPSLYPGVQTMTDVPSTVAPAIMRTSTLQHHGSSSVSSPARGTHKVKFVEFDEGGR